MLHLISRATFSRDYQICRHTTKLVVSVHVSPDVHFHLYGSVDWDFLGKDYIGFKEWRH